MNIEELKKQLNKSLIIECVSMIVAPIILIIFLLVTLAILNYIGVSENALGIIGFILAAFIVVICFILLIIKIFFTIKAMNSCIDYFNQENDEKFKKNVSTAQIVYICAIVISIFSYIISSIIPCICIISIGLYIYNLIMWFIIKDRLNTSIQSQNNQENKTTENNNIELDKQS